MYFQDNLTKRSVIKSRETELSKWKHLFWDDGLRESSRQLSSNVWNRDKSKWCRKKWSQAWSIKSKSNCCTSMPNFTQMREFRGKHLHRWCISWLILRVVDSWPNSTSCRRMSSQWRDVCWRWSLMWSLRKVSDVCNKSRASKGNTLHGMPYAITVYSRRWVVAITSL